MKGVVILFLVPALVAQMAQAPGTAAIRGRVVAADTGLPFLEAVVQVVSDETGRTGPARRHVTDARGVFEVSGLPPGSYRLLASPPADKPMYLPTDRLAAGPSAVVELEADEVKPDVDFALPRAGAISGRISDQFGQPVAGATIDVLLRGPGGRLLRVPRAFSSTLSDDFGRYRTWGFPAGTYLVRVEPRAAEAATPSREGYVRTYYPNVTGPSDAWTVKLKTSEDLYDINVRLELTRTFRLSGIVLDVLGRPSSQAVVRLDFTGERSAGAGERRATSSDGRFTFDRLAPGDYVLRATQAGDAQPRPFVPRGMTASLPARVLITGSDVVDISLSLQFGRTISGGLVTDEGAAPPFDLGAIRIRTLAAEPEDQALVPRQPIVISDNKWRFTVPDILAPVIVRLDGVPQGWFLMAVMQGADNVVDAPIDLSPGARSDLRVIVSTRGATLAGSVEDGAGRPVALCDVRVYPDADDPPESWMTGVRRALADSHGRFQMDGIPPGRYLVIAADRQIDAPVDQDAWATIRELATPVALGERERRELRLQLVAWPY